ncbi:hypothetical protein [Parasphingorhabdus sp.]|uniref:hypothetical protein n=1 Tax=Parasphingorhabdus sp. TaxID=2709688 RepID=UPI003A9407E4
MPIKNSLFLFVSVLALGACGSADADQSESSVEQAQATSADTAVEDSSAPAATVDEPAADDGPAQADNGETAAPATDKPAVAAKRPDAKSAKCKITTGGEVLKGPCLFEAGPKGSFSVETDKIPGLKNRVSSISVWMIDKGTAEVRGLTKDGINSRWGQAQRSETDKACWTGSDFEVCAY